MSLSCQLAQNAVAVKVMNDCGASVSPVSRGSLNPFEQQGAVKANLIEKKRPNEEHF